METIHVSVTGPALSFLIYETINKDVDQEGFLLGEIVEKKTETITDNDQRVVTIEKTIKVNSAVPCPKTCYFYDTEGKINRQKIRLFLKDSFHKVIAWYKHKYINTFKLTLLEKIIHMQLMELFDVDRDLFTHCLLRIESNKTFATHSHTQTFIRRVNGNYESISLHIVNLSDPNNTYKRSEPTSDTMNNIIANLQVDFKETQGLTAVSKIQLAMQQHTDNLISELSEREKLMSDLELEIEELRANFIASGGDLKEINKCFEITALQGDTNENEINKVTKDSINIEKAELVKNGADGDMVSFNNSSESISTIETTMVNVEDHKNVPKQITTGKSNKRKSDKNIKLTPQQNSDEKEKMLTRSGNKSKYTNERN